MASLSACIPSTFNGTSLFGIDITSILAETITNYSVNVTEVDRLVQPGIAAENISFCNVTVSYTHPGQDDHIVIETWMPVNNWNSRLQSVGGSGLVGGRLPLSYATMKGALADGYVTSSTDAGAPLVQPEQQLAWVLKSPGTLNYWNLENFGSRAYGEQAVLVKALIKKFYGKQPDYSYWNGCSTGGRQGLSLAQRYPDAYDGIAVGAPGISVTKLSAGISWPQMFMRFNNAFPYNCELEALRLAAIKMCDGLDGVEDGVIADYNACFAVFNPFTQVGKKIDCSDTKGKVTISANAAAVANASWHGVETADGKKMGLGGIGFTHETPFTYAMTNCVDPAGCTGAPSPFIPFYYAAMVATDPSFNVFNATHEQWDQLNYIANEKLSSFLNTDNPDLTAFNKAKGKVIIWHGTADDTVPIGGTDEYTHGMQQHQGHDDFYRYYKIPGMRHCGNGRSLQPSTLFAALENWVEHGSAPAELPIKQLVGENGIHDRILCPYPKLTRYNAQCGDPSKARCFYCA